LLPWTYISWHFSHFLQFHSGENLRNYSLARRDANISDKVLHYPTNYHSEDINLIQATFASLGIHYFLLSDIYSIILCYTIWEVQRFRHIKETNNNIRFTHSNFLAFRTICTSNKPTNAHQQNTFLSPITIDPQSSVVSVSIIRVSCKNTNHSSKCIITTQPSVTARILSSLLVIINFMTTRNT
jgi:hypothetical protein